MVRCLDDWIKRDRFVFVGWSGLLLFPTAYLAIGGRSLLVLLLLRRGTPTDSLVILRVLIFLRPAVSTPADAMGHSLLLLWGPESQATLSGGANLGDSGILLLSTVPLLSLVSCFVSLNSHVLSESVPTMRLLFQVLLPYLLVCFSSILLDNPVGSLHRRLVLLRSLDSYYSSKVSTTGLSTPSI